MHGQEIWSINENDMLNTRGRKYFRKVYGPITEYEVSRIRTDNKLGELYKTTYRNLALEWMGHVIMSYKCG
jgi:hypothetical protein